LEWLCWQLKQPKEVAVEKLSLSQADLLVVVKEVQSYKDYKNLSSKLYVTGVVCGITKLLIVLFVLGHGGAGGWGGWGKLHE
jgi:hypothetical protein